MPQSADSVLRKLLLSSIALAVLAGVLLAIASGNSSGGIGGLWQILIWLVSAVGACMLCVALIGWGVKFGISASGGTIAAAIMQADPSAASPVGLSRSDSGTGRRDHRL